MFELLDFLNSLIKLVNSVLDLVLNFIQNLLLSLEFLGIFLLEIRVLVFLFVELVLALCLFDFFLGLFDNTFLLLDISFDLLLVLVVFEKGHHTLRPRNVVIEHQVAVASFCQMSSSGHLARVLSLVVHLSLLFEQGLDVADF